MAYPISDVTRRVVYSGSAGVGPYSFSFEVLEHADIAVYKNSTLLMLTTDYTVSINADGTGSITLLVAATGADQVTLVGDRAVARSTDFVTGGDLFANSLNDEFDSLVIFAQQIKETADRGLKAAITDPTDVNMTLPVKADRKGKVLAFDSTTGDPVSGPALDSVITISAQSANINTVADNIADVNTVVGNASNINIVAGISSDVTNVADISEDVTAVAGDEANIGTVATNITNVNTVAGSIASVNTVAGSIVAVNNAASNAATATAQAAIATTQATSATGSATTATTQAGIATTKAAEASSSATAANTSAGNSAGSAAQALAIYGSTSAQQAAVIAAAASASNAAGSAASASSVVQQDLSGINLQALHRSPNAITSLFIYDTAKDSDGGAWRKRMQHTSWMNEALNGKWLGCHASEDFARNHNATYGAELNEDSEFDTTAAWVKNDASITVSGGKLNFASTPNNKACYVARSVGAGVWQKVVVVVDSISAGAITVQVNGITPFAITIPGTYTFTGVTSTAGTVGIYSSGVTTAVVDSFSVKAVSAQTTQTGDFFQLTTDGKFYKLNNTTGTTETFRGNKAEFPALSAIVAEAASVTIYDLTEPGRPMWMRFVWNANFNNMVSQTANISSVAAMQGQMAVGNSIYDCCFVRFTDDTARRSLGDNFKGNISQRNSVNSWTSFIIYGQIINRAVNAVAMTVLPDAPIDVATGLPVPTIAVGTQGGTSVIRHDGTVVNSAQTLSAGSVVFDSLNRVRWAVSGSPYCSPVPPLTAAFTGYSTVDTTWSQNPFSATSISSVISSSKVVNKAHFGGAGVGFFRDQRISSSAQLLANVTNTYNTGYMTGDIRRALLSSNVVESITAPELVTNGTFDVNTTGWADISSGTGSISWNASGYLQLNSNTTSDRGQARQTFSTVVGSTYTFTLNCVSSTHPSGGINLGTSGGGTQYAQIFSVTTGTYTHTFTATSTVLSVQLIGAYGSGTINFDNISVKQVSADRSYKNKPLSIVGTVTKALVAPSAQLVAYSGFNADNYLQEPYSADLDFGTGSWSVDSFVNIPVANGFGPHNLLTFPEQFDNAAWTKAANVTVSANAAIAPDGLLSAERYVKGLNNTAGGDIYRSFGSLIPVSSGVFSFSLYLKADGIPIVRMTGGASYSPSGSTVFNISTGVVISGTGTIVPVGDGWYRCTVTPTRTSSADNNVYITPSTGSGNTTGDGVSGYLIWGAQLNRGSVATIYRPGLTADYDDIAPIAERTAASGASIRLGLNGTGGFRAIAFDGTTTRTVNSPAAYNTATWNKVSADYSVDGRLTMRVNGAVVATTTGTPLLTMNNAAATLTVGNSFALNAPFPGSLALCRISATSSTPEQSAWVYEQEKQMFRDGAQVCLPDATAVSDLTYDDATDCWVAISATNESTFSGLVRTATAPVSAGTFQRVESKGGIKLLARATTTPGVDITMPAYGLREELVRRSEAAAALSKTLTVFNFDAIASQTDFVLPVGWTATEVLNSGASQREGTTKSFIRLFDGFKETIRFAVAPGAAAWIQITARKV